MTKLLSRLPLSGRVGLGFAAGALALLVLGIAAPGSSLFFPLVSLWCDLALFAGVLVVLRMAGVRFDLFHCAVIVGLWAAALLYFYWSLSRRDFIYYWDYANYIQKQYAAEAAFAQSPAAGFGLIFGSFAEDYTNFISLFLEFPFCLTDRTGDSFAFCQVFSVLPMLLTLLAGLVLKVGQMLRVKHRFWYFLIGLSWCATFPFVRMSAVLGQPDWFGLIFAFSILLLTLDFRFERLEPLRFVLLFAATAAVILSRRWYLYFVVGYYFSYAVLVLVSSFKTGKAGRKREALLQVRNLVLFGLLSLAAMVILLWPMVSRILHYSYADRYAYYNGGGLAWELYLQTFRVGLLNFILIGMGLWFAAKRRLPALPCLAGAELLVSLVLFTRVQNTGSHQMLLYVPAYVILFLCGAAGLAESIEHFKIPKLCFWVFTLLFAVSVRCSPLTVMALPEFVIHAFHPADLAEYQRLDELTYDRKDKPQIQAMAQWLVEHLGEGEVAYMIPDDMLYNPGHLRNCDLPNHALDGKLPDSFSVPGTHYFPTGFFDARYVVTADPFPLSLAPDTELGHRFNAVFLQLRETTHQQVATFDMGNGTVFTIWERTTPVTREEVETYLHEFDAENAKYPEMFSSVVENWLAVHGL